VRECFIDDPALRRIIDFTVTLAGRVAAFTLAESNSRPAKASIRAIIQINAASERPLSA